MAGLREVAARAGVSEATASRALRDISYVKPATRLSVLEAAKELKYGPYSEFGELAQERKSLHAIGVIAPYINRWYFSQALAGAEHTLREAGLDLLLYNFSQVKGREKLFKEQLRKSSVVGLLIVSLPPTAEEFEALLNLEVPLSFIGLSRDGSSSAGIDDREGAKIATQHLINQGHTKIGLIAGTGSNQYDFPVSKTERQDSSMPWKRMALAGTRSTRFLAIIHFEPVVPPWMSCWQSEIGQLRSLSNLMRWRLAQFAQPRDMDFQCQTISRSLDSMTTRWRNISILRRFANQ